MKQVLDYIDQRQAELPDHPFFTLLASGQPVEHLLPFVPGVAFWVMSFQDALRINARRIRDRELGALARHQLREDAGRDRWYLDDLRKIDGGVPDLAAIFADIHQACREASYELLAETLRTADDAERIALLIILESAGQVFFSRVAACFRRAGIEPGLRYFGRAPLGAGNGQEPAGGKMHDLLNGLDLPDETTARCCALADRCYRLFGRLFDALAELVQSADAGTIARMRGRASLLRTAAR